MFHYSNVEKCYSCHAFKSLHNKWSSIPGFWWLNRSINPTTGIKTWKFLIHSRKFENLCRSIQTEERSLKKFAIQSRADNDLLIPYQFIAESDEATICREMRWKFPQWTEITRCSWSCARDDCSQLDSITWYLTEYLFLRLVVLATINQNWMYWYKKRIE